MSTSLKKSMKPKWKPSEDDITQPAKKTRIEKHHLPRTRSFIEAEEEVEDGAEAEVVLQLVEVDGNFELISI